MIERLLNKIKEYYAVLLVMLVLVVIILLQMNQVEYGREGDDIITFGMANSDFDGWLLSEGKAAVYLRNHDLKDVFSDFVTNGKNAEILHLEEVEQPAWFTGQTIHNWYYLEEASRRFNYSSVYYNGLTDGGQPFLYYALVHTVSSLFPSLSFSVWSAYFINLLSLILLFVIICAVNGRMGFSHVDSAIIILFYGATYTFLETNLCCRQYALLPVFYYLMIYIHMVYFDYVRENRQPSKLWIAVFGIVYILGYQTHYLMTELMFSVFLCVLLQLHLDGKIKLYGLKYIVVSAAAVVIGGVTDPIFFKGLLDVFKSKSSIDGTGQIVGVKGYILAMFQNIGPRFGYVFVLLVIGAVVCFVINRTKLSVFLKERINCCNTLVYGSFVLFLIVEFFVQRATKFGNRYIYVIAPTCCVIIYGLFKYIYINLLKKNRVFAVLAAIVMAGVMILTAVANNVSIYQDTEENNRKARILAAAGAQNAGADCVFLGAAKWLPLLEKYNNVLTVTPQGPTVISVIENGELTNDTYIVYDLYRNAENDRVIKEMEKQGFTVSETFEDDPDCLIIKMNKTEGI